MMVVLLIGNIYEAAMNCGRWYLITINLLKIVDTLAKIGRVLLFLFMWYNNDVELSQIKIFTHIYLGFVVFDVVILLAILVIRVVVVIRRSYFIDNSAGYEVVKGELRPIAKK